jgi:flotillin
VVDRLISNMPEVVRAMAEPLSKVDRITIVSTGGDAAGANKITGDMAKMAAQVPALFEALSGMDIRELMKNIAGMRLRPDGNGSGAVGPVVDGK